MIGADYFKKGDEIRLRDAGFTSFCQGCQPLKRTFLLRRKMNKARLGAYAGNETENPENHEGH